MSWRKTRISDHCDITSSKRIFYSEYAKAGVPFYRSKEIVEKSQGQTISEPLFIRQEKYKEIKDKFGVPKGGDLLLTSVGTIGIPYIVKPEDYFYFKDGNLTWFRNFDDKLLSQYLYYWIHSNEGQGILNNTTIGSSQKALTIAALKNISIPLPPIETQCRIVFILSVYDNLIENSQKQIKLLEEAAQRLYKEWFVNLHFPGYEEATIADGVPDGWEKVSLKEFVPILTGKKDANFGTKDGAYPFFTCAQEPIKAPLYSFDADAVILAGNGDFNVKLYRGKFEAYQRTYVLIPNERSLLFLLFHAVRENMNHLFQGASGSTIKFLTKGMIENISTLIPDQRILEQFNSISEAMQAKREIAEQTIKNAMEARNRLLPKLISGELEV